MNILYQKNDFLSLHNPLNFASRKLNIKEMKKLLLFYTLISVIGCSNRTQTADCVRSVKCDSAKIVENRSEVSTFPGRVRAESESNIAFRIAGQIEKITVSEGEYVKKGTVLAYLDDRDYRIQLKATQAEYNQIESEAHRVIELFKTNSVTPNDYDKAVFGLQQITSKLEAHKNALADTRLIAPYSGYIQARYFDKGETVSAGMPVLSIISISSPEIEINIPTADFIKKGKYQSATATISAYPGHVFNLELTGINQKANLNQLYKTRFKIADPIKPAPGMTAVVSIQYSANLSDFCTIPITAIKQDSVWIVTGNSINRKPIKVIEIRTDGSAVVEGLKIGDLVVSAGINSLNEGQKVKVLPDRSKSNMGGLL